MIHADGNDWCLYEGDCVEVVGQLPDASVDLTVYSPPFCGLYIYSDNLADMGNCADSDEFLESYGYLAEQLLRVTVPGRLCAVHCKDLPRYANRDGCAGLIDFPGQLIRAHEDAGWSYHSRVTIWKCPVTERERTNNHGLLHRTVKADSSAIRQGMADYLVVFRRPPSGRDGSLLESDKPICRPAGFQRFVGAGDMDPRTPSAPHPADGARLGETDPALAVWRRYAEPVWWDIDQMDTLNQALGREAADEKHICPLQLGLIRRVVEMWSAPGDVVLSPFAGIGSEGVVALQERRKFVGVELKQAYCRVAAGNLQAAEVRQGDLFTEAA